MIWNYTPNSLRDQRTQKAFECTQSWTSFLVHNRRNVTLFPKRSIKYINFKLLIYCLLMKNDFSICFFPPELHCLFLLRFTCQCISQHNTKHTIAMGNFQSFHLQKVSRRPHALVFNYAFYFSPSPPKKKK